VADTPSGRAVGAKGSLLTLACLAVLYFVAGKLGLRLAFVNASASAVWPATGIALAAFLLLGRRAWPAILAGAYLVNVTTSGSALISLGIALGNTLEGLVGAWLVERFAGGLRAFERARSVFKFAVLAGLLSTAVSASFGVGSLWLGGLVSRLDFASVWLTWWLGDAGGGLVVAPLLLLWAIQPRPRWNRARAIEATLLLLALLAVGFSVFGGLVPWTRSLSFLSLPVLLWAALRFDQREAATATALLSGIAAFGALRGVGSFADATPNTSLVLVQAFMATISVTTLAVSATVLQRRRAEQALSRTAAIVDSSDDAIVGKALDGTIVSWNRGAEQLYGYSAAEVLGRSISILTPPDRPDEIPQILAQLRRGEHFDHYETARIRRDGRSVPVSLTVSPIHDAAGTVVGASAIARDITFKRRAEERLGGQFAVTRILAESTSLRDAAPRIVQAIGEGFGWEFGELWRVSEADAAPSLVGAWAETGASGFAQGDARTLGAALVARVRESGRHAWVEDVSVDETLSRSGAAVAGTRAALAWPVVLGSELVAVLALFSGRRRAPRQELLDQMADIATRIGQFFERERTLEGLRRLEKAVETIEMGVTITDVQGRILYTNHAEAAMHGHRPEELIGKHVSTFMPEGWTPVGGQPREIRSWKRETVNVRRDGTVFPVQLLSDAVRDRDGTPVAVVTCTEEITERKRAEEALRSSEERYRLLFERNLAGVYRATLDGRLLECNDALAQILGYGSREEVLTRTLWDLSCDRPERAASVARLRERGALTNVELRLRRKDGSTAWVLESERLLVGDDGEERVEATLVDITDRKEFQQRMEFQAFHDPLTELPNRAFLEQRLELLLSQVERGLAVMFVDLDRFKAVNDTLGHAVGDAMLREAAVRLRDSVRENDLVARVGGDEFVLLLPRVLPEGAARIARKILGRMREPFVLDGHQLQASVSVGVALFPQDGRDAQALLSSADGAMYRAKESGRDAFHFCQGDARPAAGDDRSGERRRPG
jgi:diguanylate cyclase (GGDEF)-like protein/PAS domain S-box-containing protein